MKEIEQRKGIFERHESVFKIYFKIYSDNYSKLYSLLLYKYILCENIFLIDIFLWILFFYWGKEK